MAEQKKEVVTYKALPYPLPDNVRQRLIEAGKAALESQRKNTKLDKNFEDVNLLVDTIRREIGINTTREVIPPYIKPFPKKP